MLTRKKILKAAGVPELSLYAGEGYFYFVYDAPTIYRTHSVYVYRLNDFTLERWMEEVNGFLEEIIDEVS